MYFEPNHCYHIYNQGNNRQKIFFNRDNYLYFLNKIRQHILPYADILAWCLMPNHFHLMVRVNFVELETNNEQRNPDTTHPMTSSHRMSSNKSVSINQSIAIMLRSYTRAINKSRNMTGSLFRAKTKAECLTKQNGITPSFFNSNQGTLIFTPGQLPDYLQTCFNYIHKNPVRANLAKEIADWEFSSAPDYYGIRQGSLINKTLASELNIRFLGE
ncbi:transposase [Alkalitalea saponilacus]|uniref:Putative transposase n=1 Tax=Alkalitalea saponilacus TaxID=889453 RepID=A0A1T5HTS8_9BACT|nr:transposase [Alkalitalea saponilacus]SKC24083.1 putative transposase [Alkalitalea saponilacus]